MTDTHNTSDAPHSIDGDTHEIHHRRTCPQGSRARGGSRPRPMGDTAAETVIYIERLRLTAANLRTEALAVEQDRESCLTQRRCDALARKHDVNNTTILNSDFLGQTTAFVIILAYLPQD